MLTYRKLILFIAGCYWLAYAATAQPGGNISYLHIENGCNFTHAVQQQRFDYAVFDISEDAEAILAEIREAVILPQNAFELKISDVDNALATQENGTRYILISRLFVGGLMRNNPSRWVLYSILGHEIGHHMLNHDFSETDPRTRRLMELEADSYSGRLLRALCATETDAMAAVDALPAGIDTPLYPSLSARREAIYNAWHETNESLKVGGRDRCGTSLELRFGDDEYGKRNKAYNAHALVKEEEMIITYDADALPGRFLHRSYIVTPPASNLTPRSIEWLTDPDKTGKSRQLIWHFGRDGYRRTDVLKAQELGIAVFPSDKVPQPIPFGSFSYGLAAVITGSASFIYGAQERAEGLDLYDNVYFKFRNPNNSTVYPNGPGDRQQVYNTANRQYRRGSMIRDAGSLLTGLGIYLLIDKYLEHRKSKIGNLYAGENGFGYRIPLSPDRQ